MMMIKRAVAVTLFSAVMLWSIAAKADSLYSDDPDDSYKAGLYSRHTPVLAVGDIVKVRIQEKTRADVDLGVSTQDESSSETKLETGGLLGKVLNPVFDLLGSGDFGFSNENDFSNDGRTDRNSRLDGFVTALVMDRMENGNLIIEGRKRVKVNGEDQTMLVRGLLDPRDLDSERVVDSDHIADVEIEYIGEGELSKRSKPGFLSRVIDFIF